MIERNEVYINGRWQPAHGTEVLEVTDSNTEQVIARVR